MRKVESFGDLQKEKDTELGNSVRALLEAMPRGNFPMELPGSGASASVTLLPQEDGSIMAEVFAKKKGAEKSWSYTISRDGRLVGEDPLKELGATKQDLLWHITQAVLEEEGAKEGAA